MKTKIINNNNTKCQFKTKTAANVTLKTKNTLAGD